MASERDRASRFGPWEARAGHTRRPTSEPGATCTSLSQRLGPWEARAERTRRRERQRARRTGRPKADHGLEPGQHVVGAVDLVAAGPDDDATPPGGQRDARLGPDAPLIGVPHGVTHGAGDDRTGHAEAH